ncbi:glycosyltransferase family 4 protein [Candidatus Falkowbacteria bacterium]|nr:glycosyltransferase family 4 protein [Candidatus Falkowbacteria bacterium]
MKLALFFTNGVSLKTWEKVGMFDREVKPYNRLAESFEKIYFVTYGQEDAMYSGKFKSNIVILPKKLNIPDKIYSLVLPWVYRKELKDADIYKTNQMQGAWSAIIARYLFGKKAVVRCGYQWSQASIGWKIGPIKKVLIYLLELISYRLADKVFVTTGLARDYAVKRYKLKEGKIKVVPNYIDVDLFKPLGLAKQPRSMIFIGRLEKEKNLLNLLEALEGLDVELDIYGKGVLREKLESVAKEKNLRVNLKGNLANNLLPEEINRHEIFILPSLYEGNPKVLLEAMACGSAVIGARVQGIENLIDHGRNGLLCETDSASIRQSVIEMLGDETRRQQMGAEAAKFISENNALDVILKSELTEYNLLLQK